MKVLLSDSFYTLLLSCKFGAKIIKNLKRGNKIGGKEIKMGRFVMWSLQFCGFC
jgi:hypothetical protein